MPETYNPNPPLTAEALRGIGHEAEPVLKAIRRKCLDCSGGSHSEVKDCLVPSCALYPFRLGKNPWRAPMSEAAREAAGRRLAAGRGVSADPAIENQGADDDEG